MLEGIHALNWHRSHCFNVTFSTQVRVKEIRNICLFNLLVVYFSFKFEICLRTKLLFCFILHLNETRLIHDLFSIFSWLIPFMHFKMVHF